VRRIRVNRAHYLVQFFAVTNAVQYCQPRQKPHCYFRYRLRSHLLRNKLLRAAYGHNARPNRFNGFPLADFAAIFVAACYEFENFHSAVEFSYSH